MILPLLIGALLQPMPSPERREARGLLDTPCDLGAGTVTATTLAALPRPLAEAVEQFFAPRRGIADAGGAYNATDVVDSRLPSRRFIRAYRVGPIWVVWYVRGGGIVSSPQTIAFRPDVGPGGVDAGFVAMPGTVFAGEDLCTATKAIVAGVRNGTP